RTHYYKNVVHQALPFFGITHLDQLRRLIRSNPEAAAENSIDIANTFELHLAAKSEGEILGPKVL
ncbi:hypothetical protein PMAYCL1PPCAC_29966, partial [Pristionchus mayeri]